MSKLVLPLTFLVIGIAFAVSAARLEDPKAIPEEPRQAAENHITIQLAQAPPCPNKVCE